MTTAPPPGGGEPHPSGAIDLALWERTIAGMATPAEQARVSAWVTAVAGHPPVANLLRTAVHQLEIQAGAPDLDVSSSLQRVHARIEAVTIQPRPSRPATDHRLWLRGTGGGAPWRPAIAASLLITLAVGLAISTLRHGARTVPLGREYATAPGQRLSVMLVDGTRLILAPASRARLAANYGQGAGGRREVELEGEAYFAVVHDAAHPFAVHAGNAVTTDVGTQFAVRAYVGDAAVHIAVAEGQVSVRPLRVLGARSAVSAAAGDVVSVTDTGVAVTHGVNVAALTVWVDGGLVFQHATVAEVAREISRTFDVDVRVAEAALARRHVTAAFGHDADSLEAVLSYLGLALDARVTRVGRVVTLAPRAPGSGIRRSGQSSD